MHQQKFHQLLTFKQKCSINFAGFIHGALRFVCQTCALALDGYPLTKGGEASYPKCRDVCDVQFVGFETFEKRGMTLELRIWWSPKNGWRGNTATWASEKKFLSLYLSLFVTWMKNLWSFWHLCELWGDEVYQVSRVHELAPVETWT